jgi:ADP-ribose pyrophosphatase YjhB (NUDIX family)
VRDTYCSSCGTAYSPPLVYPRTCGHCGTEVWANPIPVSVVLVPIAVDDRTGLLVIRRGIPPGEGKLALVGGFLEEHETWAEGGAREVREETAVIVAPERLEPLWFTSTAPRPNRVLLFSVAEVQSAASLPSFVANAETPERGAVFGPEGLEGVFAFPLHVEAARRFFAVRGARGPHDFRSL